MLLLEHQLRGLEPLSGTSTVPSIAFTWLHQFTFFFFSASLAVGPLCACDHDPLLSKGQGVHSRTRHARRSPSVGDPTPNFQADDPGHTLLHHPLVLELPQLHRALASPANSSLTRAARRLLPTTGTSPSITMVHTGIRHIFNDLLEEALAISNQRATISSLAHHTLSRLLCHNICTTTWLTLSSKESSWSRKTLLLKHESLLRGLTPRPGYIIL